MDGYYAGKRVLLTGADNPLSLVVVRELLRSAYLALDRLYLLVAPDVATAASADDCDDDDAAAARLRRARLVRYASHPAFAGLLPDPLADDTSSSATSPTSSSAAAAAAERLADLLEARTELLTGDAASGAALGMREEDARRVQRDVDVIVHGAGLADPCDADTDPEALHRAGASVAAFAARCPPRAVVVLPGSLLAVAVGRRFRSAPLDFAARVAEEPATGIRFADDSDEGRMPSPVVAAQAAVESMVSKLAAQGGTARVVVVRHGLVGPPVSSAPAPGLLGGFDALAFAVCVGAAGRLNLASKALVEVIPADLLAERILAAPLLASSGGGGDAVSVVHAATSSAHPVSIGMIGQYFTEYFARNRSALEHSLDYGVPCAATTGTPIRVPLSPVLAARPALRTGLARWRPELPWRPTASHIERHPHAASAARYRSAVERSAAMVKTLEKGVAASQLCFATSVVTVPGGTDLRLVEWELYCKNVARSAFLYLCRVLGVEAPRVPPPVKYCDMDDLTCLPGSSFSAPLGIIQRVVPDLHFLTTCTRQPDGSAIVYTPGLTAARRAFILDLPSVRAAIDAQAKNEKVDREAIIARAHAILDRVGDKLNVKTIRVLGLGLRKVMQIIYSHVHTNASAYEFVRRATQGIGSLRPVGRRAVVLIPSHRSYMDFLVMSYLMYMWGLPVPHICAGEDFLGLGGVSKLLRGSGAFFMRRSFKGDNLYGTLFREYARLLATDGRTIEFFIEGSRSRMGKTLAPKVGILKIMVESLLEAVQAGNTEFVDVVFVPVSVSYDKVLEGGIYTRELMGEKKPPETVGNLLSAASVLKKQFGSLNVTVGKPISLAEFILKGERGEKTPEPVIRPPVALIKHRGDGRAEEPSQEAVEAELKQKVDGLTKEDGRTLLNTLAWRITADLQSGLIVTPTALLCGVLLFLHTPTELAEGLHVDDVVSEMAWLRSQVLSSGGHMQPSTMRQSAEQLFAYAANLLEGYVAVTPFNMVLVEDPGTSLLLAIYANQMVHLFCDRALVAVAALSLPGEAAALPELSAACAVACDFMTLEFPNHRQSPVAHDAWFSDTVASLRRSLGAEGAPAPAPDADGPLRIPRDAVLTTFLANIVYPLAESYWLVAAGLAYLLGEGKVREAQFIEKLGNAVAPLLAADVLQFHTAVNREVMRNALARVKEMRLVRRSAASPQDLVLAPEMAANDAALLYERIEQVNGLRWKPSRLHREAVAAVASNMHAAKL